MNQLVSTVKLFTSVLIVFAALVSLSDASKHSPVDSKGNTLKDHANVLSDSPISLGPEPPIDPTLPRNYVRNFKQQNPNVISIGAVLESQEAIAHFLQVIEEVTLEQSIQTPGVTLYAVSIPLNENPVRTAQSVCEKLIKSQVYAILLSDGSASESSSALAVSQICKNYQIPVIGLQNRDSSFSDKHVYPTYLRTVPPFSHQVDVWIEVLKELEYKYVVVIHSADYDGRSSFTRFELLAEESDIHIKAVIEYEAGLTNIAEELEETDEEMKVRVYLLYANEIDAQAIFVEVARLNMTAPGYVWIVSEQALHAPNVPDGILGLKLFNSSNSAGHIRDAAYITGMAIKEMYLNENITRPPSTCGDLGNSRWETGQVFFNYLRKQSLSYGRTGRVTFDGKGDRTEADYEIINVVHGRPVMAGQYAYAQSKARMQLWLSPSNVIWPGYPAIKPIGYVIPTHLKIATIEEEPYVFARLPRQDGSCDYDQIPCPRFDFETRREKMYCCEGYCIDFVRSLSIRLNFSYSLYQVVDNKYGDFEKTNGTEFPRIWTGLVGDLVYKRADMVIAPLTINPERAQAIEFSKPFKYQGISILEKIKPRRTMLRFNQPFTNSLWLLVGITVHLVALALYLLDRFSPFGRYKLPNSDVTEEDALNLSSAVWFAWGVLLNSGIGEGTPRSFGGRLLGMVWAGFAMVIVASYTANLAAFLVLDRPETALTGINDARIRYPKDDFMFGTVAGSAVEMYFRRQIELREMTERLMNHSFADVEAGINAVKSGDVDAFIWDSSRLEYEAAQDCDLTMSTEEFGRSGYGIGLPKNSFWVERVNKEILAMHESGFMTELDNKWVVQGDDGDFDHCPTAAERAKPATLALSSMVGVFILVGIGIVGGIGLITIEMIYKKSQVKQQKQLDAARGAAEKWKRLVERRKVYKENVHQLRQAQLSHHKKHRRPQIPPPHQQAMHKQLEQEKKQQQQQQQQQSQEPSHHHQQQQRQQQLPADQTHLSKQHNGHHHQHAAGYPMHHHQHHHQQQQQQPQQQQQQYPQEINKALLQQQQQLTYPDQQSYIDQQQQPQQQQMIHQHHHKSKRSHVSQDGQIAHQHKHRHHYHSQHSIMKQSKQQQQQQQQAYYYHHYQPQQQMIPQQQQQQQQQQQFSQPQVQQQQQSQPASYPQVISPPEGFQSESPYPYERSLNELNQVDAEIQRKLQAKAQLYATEPRKSKKKHKSHKITVPEPMPLNDDSYELCVNSDAELHTLGLHHQQSQQFNYFSLPRSHIHHRPASTSPRSAQHRHGIYGQRKSIDEYQYNNTA